MAYEFKLPDLGEGVREGEIARWLVRVGETVAEDDPLVEIQTDKTTVEIPSPAAGTVARILVEEGKLVPVGTPLVVIGDGDVAAAPAEAQPPHAEKVQATPLVRKIAAELGVDLGSVSGTGPGGRLTEDDVRRAAPAREGERREPLRGVRREIARHLATAHREVPPVTAVEECDFGEIARTRGERSYLPYLLQATVAGLKQVPELNAALEGDEIVFWERYDLGVAVQTDQGLVVPVLRAADEKDLDELEAEAAASRRPPAAARSNRRSPRLDVHGEQRGPPRRSPDDPDRQPSRGRHPQPWPHRTQARGPRRRSRRARRRLALVHVRPSRGGRRAGERVHPGGHRPPPNRFPADRVGLRRRDPRADQVRRRLDVERE